MGNNNSVVYKKENFDYDEKKVLDEILLDWNTTIKNELLNREIKGVDENFFNKISDDFRNTHSDKWSKYILDGDKCLELSIKFNKKENDMCHLIVNIIVNIGV